MYLYVPEPRSDQPCSALRDKFVQNLVQVGDMYSGVSLYYFR